MIMTIAVMPEVLYAFGNSGDIYPGLVIGNILVGPRNLSLAMGPQKQGNQEISNHQRSTSNRCVATIRRDVISSHRPGAQLHGPGRLRRIGSWDCHLFLEHVLRPTNRLGFHHVDAC